LRKSQTQGPTGQERTDETIFNVTPEHAERCERILRNPFCGPVRYLIDPRPMANDIGLFRQAADWIPCHGSQADPLGGDELWEHVRLLAVGENGSVRCTPISTVDEAVTDLRSRV
jgi:hypothetical protein